MKQHGFGLPEAAVICAVVLVIGLLGWKYMDSQQHQQDQNTKTQSSDQNSASINSKNKVDGTTEQAATEDSTVAVARAICSDPSATASDATAQYSAKFVKVEQSKYAQFSGSCAESDETAMSGFRAFAYNDGSSWKRLSGEAVCSDMQAKGFPQDMVDACSAAL